MILSKKYQANFQAHRMIGGCWARRTCKTKKEEGFFCCKAMAINLEFMLVWMNLDSHLPSKGRRGRRAPPLFFTMTFDFISDLETF